MKSNVPANTAPNITSLPAPIVGLDSRRRLLWRAIPRPVRAAAVRLTHLLSNPATATATALCVLVGYVALWTLSAAIRNAGLPLQGDMTEAFSLSQDLRAGYEKHPPLINMIVAAWFAVMPIRPWSFYLLSLINSMIGLTAVWLAAGLVVDVRRRILAVALLTITPIFTFHAATFNHNTLQLSLWPLVALFFLASIERQAWIWSVLFGLASGLAILGKYYGVFIVLACVAAALLHPNAKTYLTSPRPYLAALTCIAIVTPNLVWLANHDLIALTAPFDNNTESTWTSALFRAIHYGGAFFANLMLVAILLWLFLPRPPAWPAATIFKNWLWQRRVIACIALVPIVLPLLCLPFLKIAPHVPWAYPAYFFLPLLIVSAPGIRITLRATATGMAAAISFAVLAALLSPLLMITQFIWATDEKTRPLAELASVMTNEWRQRTERPLRSIAGFGPSLTIAWAISFYSSDHPLFDDRSTSRVITAGMAEDRDVMAVCELKDQLCIQQFEDRLENAERLDVTIPVKFLWMTRRSANFVLYIAPATDP